MKDMGYPNVAHLESGFTGWADAGMPVEDMQDRREVGACGTTSTRA